MRAARRRRWPSFDGDVCRGRGAGGGAGRRRAERRTTPRRGRGRGGAVRLGARPPVPELLRLRAESATPRTRSAYFTGPVGDGRFAVPWTPPEWTGDGAVDPRVRLGGARLPELRSGARHDQRAGRAGALDGGAGGIDRGRAPHVIQSWLERSDGRKRHTGVAIFSAAGERRAVGARSGSSSRGRWGRERGDPARGRDRRRGEELVAAMVDEVGSCTSPASRGRRSRPRSFPRPAAASSCSARTAAPSRAAASSGSTSARARSSACTSRRTRAAEARPRAARGAGGHWRATSATRSRGSTRAPSSRAHGGCTSARATPRARLQRQPVRGLLGEKRL